MFLFCEKNLSVVWTKV